MLNTFNGNSDKVDTSRDDSNDTEETPLLNKKKSSINSLKKNAFI